MGGATNADQLYHLYLSAGFGFVVGGYYDLFRIMRLIMPCRRVTVFWQDVVFCVTAAVASFLFDMTMTGGKLRWYLFVGMAVGGVAYRLTMGRLVSKLAPLAAKGCAQVWRWITAVLGWPWRRMKKVLRRPMQVLVEKCEISSKKVADFLKNLLKRGRGLLYNGIRKRVPHHQTGKAGGEFEGDQIHQ